MQQDQQRIIIEQKLQALRKEWTKYPERRKTIELRARALKLALQADTLLEDKVIKALV